VVWLEARLLRCCQKDDGVGLAVFKVAARDVRAEHVKQGHYLVDEVVQQIPLSRANIERVALKEFAGVFRREG
jgi:hypothetical protein